MKLIHISDLHLDSKLSSNFDPLIAKQRNNELLVTLEKLFEKLNEESFDGMIIAGDLFDTKKISSKAFSYIIELIKNHPDKKVFYVAGNHDGESLMIKENKDIPENFYIFTNKFEKYDLRDDICVGGIKLEQTNCATFYDTINFDTEKINIMLLHGSITKSLSGVSNSAFFGASLKNKNIDYLALGHIHEYSSGKIDKRCTYVYPGCLEPRGFDEIGEKGYVEIEINEHTKTISHQFIPFSSRTVHEIEIDISTLETSREILELVYQKATNIKSTDILKVVLVGTHAPDLIKSISLIHEELSAKYYSVKINDKSKLKIDLEKYQNDISLKGAFIRKVYASKLSEQDKAEVVLTGLKALDGEDVE